MRAHYFTGVVLAVLASAATARVFAQQSLADIARQEEERRKTVHAPAKVYTNKDLSPVAAPPPAAAAPTDAKDAKAADDSKGGKDSKGAKDGQDAKDSKDAKDTGKKDVKDQAYWSGRLKGLQQQLDRDTSFSIALQTRINSLLTDFVNRDDPVQKAGIERDRQKALAELDGLKKTIVDDKKAIADFEEEARRAGVPPGWLR
jgi:hypothetical protein